MVRKVVLPSSRKHSKKAVMFITDGNSNLGRPGPAARRVKSKGVEIYVIGIGRNIRREELRSIASWPYDEHLFQIEKRMDIADLIESLTGEIIYLNRLTLIQTVFISLTTTIGYYSPQV